MNINMEIYYFGLYLAVKLRNNILQICGVPAYAWNIHYDRVAYFRISYKKLWFVLAKWKSDLIICWKSLLNLTNLINEKFKIQSGITIMIFSGWFDKDIKT